jgi:hypothetical protein
MAFLWVEVVTPDARLILNGQGKVGDGEVRWKVISTAKFCEVWKVLKRC